MKHLPALTAALTLMLFSVVLCIAALVMLMAAAWLALLAPPATLMDNCLLAQTLVTFSMSAFLGGRYLNAAICAWAAVPCRRPPSRQTLYWQAGFLLYGLIVCLATFS